MSDSVNHPAHYTSHASDYAFYGWRTQLYFKGEQIAHAVPLGTFTALCGLSAERLREDMLEPLRFAEKTTPKCERCFAIVGPDPL